MSGSMIASTVAIHRFLIRSTNSIEGSSDPEGVLMWDMGISLAQRKKGTRRIVSAF
jgi:hypothetical protein